MKTLVASLALFLFGLSSAHAGEAVATTSHSQWGLRTTKKTWSLNNGTQIEHTTKYGADGKVAGWERKTTSAQHPNRATVRGVYLGNPFTVHEGTLGGATIRQTVVGKGGPDYSRRLEITNGDGRAGYRLDENAWTSTVTKQ